MMILDTDTNTLSPVDTEALPPTSVIICCRAENDPGIFTDNVEDVCHDCGSAVVYRPDVPAAFIKVCTGCVEARMRGGRA